MGTTLYLLRQHPDQISSSIFHPDDEGIDLIFVEQATVGTPASMKGCLVPGSGVAGKDSHPAMTYDDLVEKIFSSDHVIVV